MYTLDTYSENKEGENGFEPAPTNFLDFVERGYTDITKPTCKYGGEGWYVQNEDNFLLDCTPDSVSGNDWAAGTQVEDQCEAVDQVVYENCQKKLIGIAPSDAKVNDADVTNLINDHKSYLENSFGASIGANDLVKIFER